MIGTQHSFSPIDYTFKWDGNGWYDYDEDAGKVLAKKDRDDYAAELKRDGYKVRKSVRKNNLRSKGGIGSGNPHIELVVPSFLVTVVG
jgi:hypothetical protein